ncbi:MAG TPA: hypothetical protein VM097_11995 [Mycobacteriales bacterium]|nr:hypothetical protein [Mycobacteriales bacterium]
MTTELGEGRPLSTRAKVLIAVGGTLLLLSMLLTGIFGFLLAPPKKVLVVTMEADAGQVAREQLKADCGRLPGVKVVADQGNRDPHVQGRFPVRFDLGGATVQEEAALETCINRHDDTVRGFLTEGDR